MDTVSDIVAKLNAHKLPKERQPPMSEIADAVDSRISQHLQNFFVQDLQNDCACSIETYDAGLDSKTFYLSSDGVKKIDNSFRLELPMLENISEQDVLNVLATACKHAGNEMEDVYFRKMVFNPESNSEAVLQKYLQYAGDMPHSFCNGKSRDWIQTSLVPVNKVYFLPDPEFLGVIAANIGQFGVFCISAHIVEFSLEKS